MKISGIRSTIVALPADEPLAGAAENPSGTRPIVTVEVETDDGPVGLGVTYFGGSLTGTLKSAVDELGALTVGEDPHRVEAVAAKLRAAAGSAGPGGVFNLAISALDTALWDIRGKALGLPLWKLLGGARERVPSYASGALMRGLSLDRVVAAAATLKDKGWREMKTQLALPGETTPAIEVERMRRVRDAIGPDIKLMCDINQRWRPEQAIDIGRRVEDSGVGLFWLEDVTTADDFAPAIAADRLLSGFYLNELLLKLTVAHDPQPELYAHYASTLERLRSAEPLEALLRRFEKRLLDLLGYGSELSCEASGRAVSADGYYHFQAGAGLSPTAAARTRYRDACCWRWPRMNRSRTPRPSARRGRCCGRRSIIVSTAASLKCAQWHARSPIWSTLADGHAT